MLFNGRALIFTFSGTQVRIAEIERLQSLFKMSMDQCITWRVSHCRCLAVYRISRASTYPALALRTRDRMRYTSYLEPSQRRTWVRRCEWRGQDDSCRSAAACWHPRKPARPPPRFACNCTGPRSLWSRSLPPSGRFGSPLSVGRSSTAQCMRTGRRCRSPGPDMPQTLPSRNRRVCVVVSRGVSNAGRTTRYSAIAYRSVGRRGVWKTWSRLTRAGICRLK